jgi:adenylate cyclase
MSRAGRDAAERGGGVVVFARRHVRHADGVDEDARTYLRGLGITEERLDAVPADDWYLLVQEHLFFGGPPLLTAEVVAARCDVDVTLVRRLWRVLGFGDPGDEAVFREQDVAMFEIYRDGVAFFGAAPLEHFARTLGATARRLTDATNALFLESLGAVRAASTHTEQLQLAQIGGELLTRLPDDVLRPLVFRYALASQLFARAAGATDTPRLRVAVGFCDLVGSTALLNALPADVAGRAVLEFEAEATDVVYRHEGHIVKLIGDEVMFITVARDDAEAIGRELLEWVAAHEVLTGARAAVAEGEVLARGGDVYGPTVNLAARLVGIAAPSTIAVADDDGEDVVEVRGFAAPVRVRTVTVG